MLAFRISQSHRRSLILLSLFLSPPLALSSPSPRTNALEHGLARNVAADHGEDVARVELGHCCLRRVEEREFFVAVGEENRKKSEKFQALRETLR